MDHLDPYFLMELYAHQSPTLLLAETLTYLVPTLRANLPDRTRIETLKHLRAQMFAGEVELTGLIFVEDRITNEDDVMTLFVYHGQECAYFEIDTVPPMIFEEQEKLLALFARKKYERRLYVASANELEGNLKIFDYDTTAKRKTWETEYIEKRTDQIAE